MRQEEQEKWRKEQENQHPSPYLLTQHRGGIHCLQPIKGASGALICDRLGQEEVPLDRILEGMGLDTPHVGLPNGGIVAMVGPEHCFL